jgi:putative tryptophan/tyrosine transport system substrate-binding protein
VLSKAFRGPAATSRVSAISWLTFAAKKLQLLQEVIPRAAKIGVFTQPGNPFEKIWREQYTAAAAELRQTVVNLPVQGPGDVPVMLEAAHAANIDALISSPLFPLWVRRRDVMEFAAEHRVPTLYNWAQEAREGGLMSYGPDPLYQARRTAGYVVKVLGGTNPATLPVEQPTKLLLILNLKTARAIGMDFPPTLLARADEVIE